MSKDTLGAKSTNNLQKVAEVDDLDRNEMILLSQRQSINYVDSLFAKGAGLEHNAG